MDSLRSLARRLFARRSVSAIVAVLVLGALVGGLIVYGASADRRGDSTEFNVRDAPGRSIGDRQSTDGSAVGGAPWPLWGYDVERTRYLADSPLRPPYTQRWMFRARSLLEFPPVIGAHNLYFGADSGRIFAVAKSTGAEVWSTRTPGPIAASAALRNGMLYQPVMDGNLYVLDAATGEIAWRFKTGGRIESSPLLVGQRVIFGSHDHKVYALDVRTHRAAWTFRAGDRIKGAVALHGRTVYVGSYDGRLYALRLRDGSLLWSTQTRRGFSFGGNLYSTPTVAYGRVYVGSTDGRVYSLGAKSGKIIWAKATGDWVYSSPAVAHRTVYVGSYDGYLYAFDARTGDRRWRFKADDRISGSPTVIGDTVYFASLGGTTYGVNRRSGRMVWTFPDGKYTPVVADGNQLFVTGKVRQYALDPS